MINIYNNITGGPERPIRFPTCILSRIMFCIAFLCCAGAIVYPLLSNYLYDQRQDRIIVEYDENVKGMDEASLDEEWAACHAYNQAIRQVSGVVVEGQNGSFQYNGGEWFDDGEYERRLNLSGNGVMGYIIIPKINVNLPVRHYTTANVLESGIGHLPESSLPVGGESTHAVLTGHTGSTDKAIFTDLHQLKEGDCFIVSVLGEKLIYEVDQILTVLPYETDALMIEMGKDYVTLITCTPYGINSHRLLVRGERMEVTEELLERLGLEDGNMKSVAEGIEKNEEEKYSYSVFLVQYLKALLLAGMSGGAIVTIYIAMRRMGNRKRQKRSERKNKKI